MCGLAKRSGQWRFMFSPNWPLLTISTSNVFGEGYFKQLKDARTSQSKWHFDLRVCGHDRPPRHHFKLSFECAHFMFGVGSSFSHANFGFIWCGPLSVRNWTPLSEVPLTSRTFQISPKVTLDQQNPTGVDAPRTLYVPEQ